MLIPPLTLVCEFGMSGLWLQDRTIRQLKEEAQHLSKLGVRHVTWVWMVWSWLVFGDFVFSTTLSWCFLSRCSFCQVSITGCAMCNSCQTGVEEEHAQGICMASMLGCTSYFWWYNVVVFIEVAFIFKEARDINLDAE